MNSIITPILAAIAGATIGGILSYFLARYKRHSEIEVRVIEEFFKVRNSLCEILSELSTLQPEDVAEKSKLSKRKRELTRIYWQQYDFLPLGVLNEMDCLYACLKDPIHNLYTCDENRIRLMREKEIQEALLELPLTENIKYYMLNTVCKPPTSLVEAARINLQAQCVLIAINRNFAISQLSRWTRFLPKHNGNNAQNSPLTSTANPSGNPSSPGRR